MKIVSFIIVTFVALGLVLGFNHLIQTKEQDYSYVNGRVTAVTRWTEQTFNEAFFGDGVRQLRRRFEARRQHIDNTITYVNYRYISGGTNNTSRDQEIQYTSSTLEGNLISTTAQARSRWLQVEVGYTFKKETTTTHQATATIAPGTRVEIWQTDVIVMQQWIWVDVFRQRLNGGVLGIGASWQDTGERWFEDELIHEFRGENFIFNEFKT